MMYSHFSEIIFGSGTHTKIEFRYLCKIQGFIEYQILIILLMENVKSSLVTIVEILIILEKMNNYVNKKKIYKLDIKQIKFEL